MARNAANRAERKGGSQTGSKQQGVALNLMPVQVVYTYMQGSQGGSARGPGNNGCNTRLIKPVQRKPYHQTPKSAPSPQVWSESEAVAEPGRPGPAIRVLPVVLGTEPVSAPTCGLVVEGPGPVSTPTCARSGTGPGPVGAGRVDRWGRTAALTRAGPVAGPT